MSRERLSVSLPAELVAWVKAEAAKNDETQSAVIERALRGRRSHEISVSMLTGVLEDDGHVPDPAVVDRWAKEIARSRPMVVLPG